MKIELRNIKHMPSLSEETECFSATIYVDGKKRGTASNRGTGGMTDIYPHELVAELNVHAKTLPPWKCGDKEYPMDAEGVIDDLLGDELQRRVIKRLCAKKTLFREPGKTYADGEYEVINVRYGPVAIAWVRDKYGPTAQILNETLR